MEFEDISKSEAVKLMGLVPSLTSWLTASCNNAGITLALKANKKESVLPKEVKKTLKCFKRLKPLTHVSNAVLRTVYRGIDRDVLFRVLFLILSNSKAPLITSHCYLGLKGLKEPMAKFSTGEEGSCLRLLDEEKEEFLEEFWTVLSRLPIVNFYALSDLCGIVQDGGQNIERICQFLAPKVFLPEEATKQNKRKTLGKEGEHEAFEIMMFLVRYYDVLFFKKQSIKVPYGGYRENIVDTERKQPAPETVARINELEAFYIAIDPLYKEIAKGLFEYFDFSVIAQAVWNEYHVLPNKWVTGLDSHTNNPQCCSRVKEWFKNEKYNLVEVANISVSSVNIPEKDFTKLKGGEKIDMVVQELFCGEYMYYNRLKLLKEGFVAELLALSNRPKSDRKIGLTKPEIKRIFGGRLDKVIKASSDFIVRLEGLRLIRTNVVPGREGQQRTRAGLLAETFCRYGGEFRKSYTEYTQTQSKCAAILSKASLSQSQKERNNEMAFTNVFSELVKSNRDIMFGQGLETLLMGPCKRFIDYKLMFERMLKEVKKLSGDYSGEIKRLEKAYRLCDVLASELNVNIKRAKVVDKVLGDTHIDSDMED